MKPLIDLLKLSLNKGSKSLKERGTEQEEAFNLIKTSILTAIKLKHPQFGKQFYVHSDASKFILTIRQNILSIEKDLINLILKYFIFQEIRIKVII